MNQAAINQDQEKETARISQREELEEELLTEIRKKNHLPSKVADLTLTISIIRDL